MNRIIITKKNVILIVDVDADAACGVARGQRSLKDAKRRRCVSVEVSSLAVCYATN